MPFCEARARGSTASRPRTRGGPGVGACHSDVVLSDRGPAAGELPALDVADPAADLARLRKSGYTVVTASSGRGEAVRAAKLPRKSVLVLGSEGRGISKGIDGLADRRVHIPGTGAVESLNVAVACGILLSELA